MAPQITFLAQELEKKSSGSWLQLQYGTFSPKHCQFSLYWLHFCFYPPQIWNKQPFTAPSASSNFFFKSLIQQLTIQSHHLLSSRKPTPWINLIRSWEASSEISFFCLWNVWWQFFPGEMRSNSNALISFDRITWPGRQQKQRRGPHWDTM